MSQLPPNSVTQACTSIGSHNEMRLLSEWCEPGVKKACRNGTQICEMVIQTQKETGTIDLHGLESIARRMTEIRNAALLFLRLREMLLPETGNTASTRELDEQIMQIASALAFVNNRIRNYKRSARNRTTN